MKMVESKDGSIKVVELDPSKHYWIILNERAGTLAERFRRRDGMIYVLPRGAKMEIIENIDQLTNAE